MATLTRDQFQLLGGYSNGPLTSQNVSGNNWEASQFTPSVTGNLNKIYVSVRKVGTPGGDLVVHIRAVSSSVPTGSDLASQNITAASITTEGMITVTFSSPPALTSGTTYTVLFSCADGLGGSPSATNCYKIVWGGADYNSASLSDSKSTDGGSTWSTVHTRQCVFMTEMSVAVATPGCDQFCLNGSQNPVTVSFSPAWYAQTFTPSVTGPLPKIVIYIYRDNVTFSPTTIEFDIQGVDGSNHPNGSNIASQTITISTLATTDAGSKYTLTFSSPPTLTASTPYALVMKTSGLDGTHRIYFSCQDGPNNYSGGSYWRSTNSGTTWNTNSLDSNADWLFASYATEVTTTSQTINSNATVRITSTQTIDSDAFCGHRTLKTIDSDSQVAIVTSHTINSGATVKVTQIKTINSDAVVYLVTTQTIDAISTVQATATKTIDAVAFCGQETSRTIQASAWVGVIQTVTIDSSAFCGQESTKIISSDTDLYLVTSQTVDSDSVVYITTTQTIDSDSNVLLPTTRVISADAFCGQETSQTIDAAAHMLATTLQSISANAQLMLVRTQTVTSSAIMIVGEPNVKLYMVE